jgi:hypothetical protein
VDVVVYAGVLGDRYGHVTTSRLGLSGDRRVLHPVFQKAKGRDHRGRGPKLGSRIVRR